MTKSESGTVSHDEAERIAQAFIDEHFGNKQEPHERVVISIPANEGRDFDLRLHAYISQRRERDAKLDRQDGRIERLRAALVTLQGRAAVSGQVSGALVYEAATEALAADDAESKS